MENTNKVNKKIIIRLSIIIVAFLMFNAFEIIDTGHTGVVKTLGSVNSENVATEGFNLKIPFLQTIVEIDNRVKKEEAKASAASKDMQNVDTLIAVNYSINTSSSANLYKRVGTTYGETIIDPAIQEAIKAITAKYTAENLIIKRDEVSTNVRKLLNDKVKSYGIDIKSVNIKNFKFSERFTQAVESKQEAEQLALKAKQDLERIKTEAQQKIESAKAEAESLRIQKEQITPELIQLRKVENQANAIKKWNGILPTTSLDSSSGIILNSN